MKTATKQKKPACYAAPLRSRKAQVAWLLDHKTHHGFLSWNVKLYHVNLDFDHLLEIYKKKCLAYHGAVGQEPEIPRRFTDAKWLAEARAKHEEVKENLFEWGVEDACRNINDGDGYQELWNGKKFNVEYAFVGRSNGHLVIQKFDGMDMDSDSLERALTDEDDPMTAEHVRDLYQFVVQCDHDFSNQNANDEVEYMAASSFFDNVCNDIELDPLPEDTVGQDI